jgi:hypothetical protein
MSTVIESVPFNVTPDAYALNEIKKTAIVEIIRLIC